MCTKFQRNLKWVVIFHVEHLWNDPPVSALSQKWAFTAGLVHWFISVEIAVLQKVTLHPTYGVTSHTLLVDIYQVFLLLAYQMAFAIIDWWTAATNWPAFLGMPKVRLSGTISCIWWACSLLALPHSYFARLTVYMVWYVYRAFLYSEVGSAAKQEGTSGSTVRYSCRQHIHHKNFKSTL